MLNGFVFKEFRIRHDRCAMKVGTDGVLLGAWACGGDRILDIGSGSGLVAMMRNSYCFTMAICGHGNLSILSMRW